ncbi:squalene synthase HpnC [Baekduia soli]|uniref:Squalene synthase HpnC n=1 Tax=Baekduia soli TaxID=496014 RepID=A0A5B8UBI8_9ACTN|nr:squalene synthase HpnC [Baekduia soli]QEC50400.1 squalene synthase HpnC [Baekduia soli]
MAPGAPSAAAVMERARHENFPVAGRVLPRAQRDHLLAVYGYARLVDDLGDEAAGDRGALLDWVDGELDAIYAGRAPEHELMVRLARTVAACDIPRDPLQRLVAANRQDQVVARYADFDALVDYCRLSATPVGELVLRIFGVATPDRIALSDDICTALQVVEHLQDVGEDRAAGRVYLPQDDLAACGCPEGDLDAPVASPALRRVVALEAGRARALLGRGAPLVRRLPVRPALAVAAFVAGGHAAADALERAGWDVLGTRARPTRGALALRLVRTLGQVAR